MIGSQIRCPCQWGKQGPIDSRTNHSWGELQTEPVDDQSHGGDQRIAD